MELMELWELVLAAALLLFAGFYGIKGMVIAGSITIQAIRQFVSRKRR